MDYKPEALSNIRINKHLFNIYLFNILDSILFYVMYNSLLSDTVLGPGIKRRQNFRSVVTALAIGILSLETSLRSKF